MTTYRHAALLTALALVPLGAPARDVHAQANQSVPPSHIGAERHASPESAHPITTPQPRRRTIVPVRTSLAWQIGGTESDTTFLLPFAVAATPRHFVVYDAVAHRLVALMPASGRESWRFGRRGRGPNEFGGIVFLSPLSTGGVLVFDQAIQRLSTISEEGILQTQASHPVGSGVRGACQLKHSQIRLRGEEDREIERSGGDSATITRSALPWPELASQPSLVRQSRIFPHPRGDVCLVTLTFGPRFALLDDTGTRAVGTWAEEVPLGRARSLGKGSWTMEPGQIISAGSATGVGDAFAVLFVGRSQYKRRIVDFHSATDGRYLLSVVLPFEAKTMAYGHDLLVLAGETSDGAPFVRALRTTPNLEELVVRALESRR